MPAPTSTDILVNHPLPLLAAGLVAALSPGAVLLDDATPASLPDQPASGVLVCDLAVALDVLAQDHPRPGQPWQPRRCVVVSLDSGCSQVQHALQQGVLAIVQVGCAVQELQRAVAAAARWQRFLCSATASRMAQAAVDEPLTPREAEVLRLLCLGLDNKSIALHLHMALGTAKTHVKAILDKLGASSRTQAVAAAHRRGMAPLDAPLGSLPSASGGPGSAVDQRLALRTRRPTVPAALAAALPTAHQAPRKAVPGAALEAVS